MELSYVLFLNKKYYLYFCNNQLNISELLKSIAMNISHLKIGKRLILLFTFLIFIFWGCASDKGKSSSSDSSLSKDLSTGIETDLAYKINTAKKIFYSLPSPLETAIILKSAGASYEADLLNPFESASKYSTNLQMALNLGIFTTDLSYASLFDQTQATLNYINAAKKMADGLEILDAIDAQTIQRLEENINSRDVIIDIISETLLNSNSFLEDKGLQATSSVILVGGWVEGLHIATNLVADNADLQKNKLIERIVDQKLSLGIVINLLENNKENPDVQAVIADITKLKEIYDKITIEQSEITAVEDKNTNVTTLKSESKIKITKEVFIELKKQIKEIRTRYIS